jgi:hypothetical protein
VKEVDPKEMLVTNKKILKLALVFKASEDNKQVDLVEGDDSQQATIGAGLD